LVKAAGKEKFAQKEVMLMGILPTLEDERDFGVKSSSWKSYTLGRVDLGRSLPVSLLEYSF
jgi:hypothetical protein